MPGGVFVIKTDGTLVEMSGQLFDSEDRLQTLIAKYPGLLGGDQMNLEQPRRFLLLKRELGLSAEEGAGARWAVDHLFVDQDATPTIVEGKRSTDTRIRREVVGQLLEYAANAVANWPVQLLQQSFDATCKELGRDPNEALAAHLEPGSDAGGFWERVQQNLENGNIRLLFVADDIPAELRRIVEFLNTHMDPIEVLAVEVKQYQGHQMTTLVPRLIGQTEETRRKKGGRESRTWDEASFFSVLEAKRGSEETSVARRIFDWAKENASYTDWGSGKQDGSFVPVLTASDVEYYPIVVYTYGRVEIQFQHLIPRPPFHSEPKRRELLMKLNDIDGIDLPADSIARRPSIQLRSLVDHHRLNRFLKVLDWVKSEISKGSA